MNTNLLFGTIAFLLWSVFSTWVYVCQIKGLCLETENTMAVVTVAEEPIKKTVERKPFVDTTKVKPRLLPINIEDGNIFFLINTAEFLDQALADRFVKETLPVLSSRQYSIEIVGYTCDLGSAQYNQKLGLERAKTMQTFLSDVGIKSEKTEIKTGGEIQIISKNNAENERQSNRKVTITIKSIDL